MIENNVTNIIIADDHQMYAEALASVLNNSKKRCLKTIAIANNGDKTLELLQKYPTDLLLLDLNMPVRNGMQVLQFANQRHANLKVIVLSMENDGRSVKQALRLGAQGYILKQFGLEELYHCINEVLQGRTYVSECLLQNGQAISEEAIEDRLYKKYGLTKREVEILRLISKALSNKEIAKELFISDQTVSVHRKNLMRKVGVSNAASLVKVAYEYALM